MTGPCRLKNLEMMHSMSPSFRHQFFLNLAPACLHSGGKEWCARRLKVTWYVGLHVMAHHLPQAPSAERPGWLPTTAASGPMSHHGRQRTAKTMHTRHSCSGRWHGS